MFGLVEVTAERLQRIADKYNRQRATALNENDYAPILVNHMRDADLVQGRVLADLEVAEWLDPDTGTMGKGLFGTLRVDDPEGIKKVESGKYAQVSLSFDEDDDTLWEVSFVAVEAARRSQALEQGDTQMSAELAAQLKQANDSHQALQARVKESVTVRKAIALSATENLSLAESELGKAVAALSQGLKDSKTALLKSQFKGFIRTGQLSKAEFDKVDFASLSGMSSDAIKMLLDSYRSRPVSPHVTQFGQSGAQPVAGKMTPAQMRAASKAQKEGKSIQLDAADGDGDDDGDQGKDGKKGAKEASAEGEDTDLGDYEGALKKMGEIEPIVSKAKEFLGKMSESLKKLGEQNDKDAA